MAGALLNLLEAPFFADCSMKLPILRCVGRYERVFHNLACIAR